MLGALPLHSMCRAAVSPRRVGKYSGGEATHSGGEETSPLTARVRTDVMWQGFNLDRRFQDVESGLDIDMIIWGPDVI